MIFKDAITDPQLMELAKMINADTGFDVLQYKERPLKRRLAVRLRACQLSTYQEYAQRLVQDKSEYPKLLDALTINVTNFYRNPETFKTVSARVLPLLAVQGEQSRPLTIWSAGCSSGEEAYSLAILWREFAAGNGVNRPYRIIATDIDRVSRAKAKQGIYDQNSMNEIPSELIKKYFKLVPPNYILDEEIKRMVEFRHFDLFEPSPFSELDMIFCRNVLIYFSRQAQEYIFDSFRKSLRSGGFLVLGKVETLFGKAKECFSPFDLKERIYQLNG
ncbi:protein-glutamate O-methyltransferase CheR [candidate division TA06 bacterium]|uniref:protein-glutamate O-methyltransferase n=1 Tax=candidate division TA06 bacterium TaxID=2250710 RepID=A0A933MKU8_UNCT6|nr:protein-glutamate O-methyltransferase CheR [candidate division TA06 bacterium]